MLCMTYCRIPDHAPHRKFSPPQRNPLSHKTGKLAGGCGLQSKAGIRPKMFAATGRGGGNRSGRPARVPSRPSPSRPGLRLGRQKVLGGSGGRLPRSPPEIFKGFFPKAARWSLKPPPPSIRRPGVMAVAAAGQGLRFPNETWPSPPGCDGANAC